MIAQPERMFVFRLARELGMSVSRLLSEVDAREIAEWQAYFIAEARGRKAEKESGLKAALQSIAPKPPPMG